MIDSSNVMLKFPPHTQITIPAMLVQRYLKSSALTARTISQVGCPVAKLSLRRVSTTRKAFP
jgi:hypothetical protein